MKKIIRILGALTALCTLALFQACSEERLMLAPPEAGDESEIPVDVEPLTKLHVDGRYLKNDDGKIVNLHGFCQIFDPYQNQYEWDNRDVDGALRYGRKMIDGLATAGWEMDFMRLQWSAHWTTPLGLDGDDFHKFDYPTFEKYLELVHIPIMKYAISKGIYVVICPPLGCPREIAVGDDFHEHCKKVWQTLASHPFIKNNPSVMFELANEPQNIKGAAGDYGCSNTGGYFENWKIFFQEVVDVIRGEGARNIIWVPGLGYSSLFGGCTSRATRIEGDNIGYAVHCYPGWMNSDGENGDGGIGEGGGYQAFQAGWDAQVKPVSDVAPVIVTEMDWAPSKYNSSWGSAYTGEAGGAGFGANFKYIADRSGNVSWVIFTGTYLLRQFKDEPGEEGNYTFLNDPEACPWAVYHWFKEYREGKSSHGIPVSVSVRGADNGTVTVSVGKDRYLIVDALYSDGTSLPVTPDCVFTTSTPSLLEVEGSRIKALREGKARLRIEYSCGDADFSLDLDVESSSFAFSDINPSIWGDGTFNPDTGTLVIGEWGFGGWQFVNPVDLSGAGYLVVELGNGSKVDGTNSLRVFDTPGYFGGNCASYPVDDYRVVVDLSSMVNEDGGAVDPSHTYIVGFWSPGGKDNTVVIHRIYTSTERPADPYSPSGDPDGPDDPALPDDPDPVVPPGPGAGDLVLDFSAFNPDIFADGTFDVSTGRFVSGQWGFGGWEKTDGTAWDLSAYRYLVVELGEESRWEENGWCFNIFDNGYWDTCVSHPLASLVDPSTLSIRIDLSKDLVCANGRNFDKSHVNIMGFWGQGNDEPIFIKRVYATK